MKAAFIALLAGATSVALAHDIWIEPSVGLVRSGDWLRLSLMLGNHGNEHRDFRLASKVAVGSQNMAIFGPNGKVDLTRSLVDCGLTPQEGFWSARFQPDAPGLYMAVSTFDKVMSYAPVRDIKCAKAFFISSPSLDNIPTSRTGFDRTVGAPLEIVPLVSPFASAGKAMKVQVLYKGKPLGGCKVSFIPRGAEAKGDLDPRFETNTDSKGIAQMVLREANTYLISTHWSDGDAKGKGYEAIEYSATLCLLVSGRR